MIQFKTPRIGAEFNELSVHNPRLKRILGMVNDFSEIEFGKSAVITCIFRSEAENAALYAPKQPPIWRPHTLWCGADLRSSIYTPTEITKLLGVLNSFTVFKGTKQCGIYHAITGNAPHFHVQVSKE